MKIGIIYCIHIHFYDKYTSDDKKMCKMYKLGYTTLPFSRMMAYDDFGSFDLMYYKHTSNPYLIEQIVFNILDEYRYGSGEFFFCDIELIKKVFDEIILMTTNVDESILQKSCGSKPIRRSRKKLASGTMIDDTEIDSMDLSIKPSDPEELKDIIEIFKSHTKTMFCNHKDTIIDCHLAVYGEYNHIMTNYSAIFGSNNTIYGNYNIIFSNSNTIFGSNNIIMNANNTVAQPDFNFYRTG